MDRPAMVAICLSRVSLRFAAFSKLRGQQALRIFAFEEFGAVLLAWVVVSCQRECPGSYCILCILQLWRMIR